METKKQSSYLRKKIHKMTRNVPEKQQKDDLKIKHNINENFNLKIDEINLEENNSKDYSISAVYPHISSESELPIFKMIFCC